MHGPRICWSMCDGECLSFSLRVHLSLSLSGSYVMRDRKNKWYVPTSVYPHFKFPTYVDGPAYVITGDLVQTIAHRADLFPFLFLEDVFVTGELREFS